MKFLKEKEENDYTIIIGCGRLGAKIANTLSDKGENVLVIDKNGDSFRRLSSDFGGLSIVGDGTDFEVLKEAQIQNASVVMVVTNKDNRNIMAAQMAKDVFKVPHVVARLYDPEKKKVFQDEKIHVICPSLLSIQEIRFLLEESEWNVQKGEAVK